MGIIQVPGGPDSYRHPSQQYASAVVMEREREEITQVDQWRERFRRSASKDGCWIQVRNRTGKGISTEQEEEDDELPSEKVGCPAIPLRWVDEGRENREDSQNTLAVTVRTPDFDDDKALLVRALLGISHKTEWCS